MGYYLPPNIFRQNAMKKVRSNPDFPTYTQRKSSNESWLFNEDKNTDVLDKTFSTDKVKIASSYWRVPDDDLHLTSFAVNKENTEQIAVASGKRESNLFVYGMDVDMMSLTHQQTITLPYIQSMEWTGYDESESTLLTGHKNGTVHLVSIPESNSEESATIIKRYNHKKHFNTDRHKILSIKRIVLPEWVSNSRTFITQCNQNIFLWDMNHRSDLPIIKNQNIGLLNFDCSPSKNGILALAGEFGIALNDLRASVNEPSIFTPKDSHLLGAANTVKWAPYDDNILAASHLDGTVRLWDIRAQGSFGKLSGHTDLVTCIEWSEESSSDLYTGSSDGSIIHWELNFDENLSDCCLNEGLDSIKYMGDKFLTNETDIYATVSKRQCGTLIPAAKTAIVDMTSVNNKLVSIDGSSFFGVHAKRGLDSFTVDEGTSEFIMEELLSALPGTIHREEECSVISDSEEDSNSIFDQITSMESTPSSTANSSPIHTRSKSITNFLNNSENSIDTLVDLDRPQKTIGRRTSGSTLNSTISEIDDQELSGHNGVVAGFTYEKIMPLTKSVIRENDAGLVSMQAYRSMVI